MLVRSWLAYEGNQPMLKDLPWQHHNSGTSALC